MKPDCFEACHTEERAKSWVLVHDEKCPAKPVTRCESDHCGRKNPATASYKNAAGVSFHVCATCEDPDFLASLGFVRADIAARVGATVGELANAEAGR